MFPYEGFLDIQTLIAYTRDHSEASARTLEALGVNGAGGRVRLTKDPKILQQLDASNLQVPGLFKTGEEWDKLHVKIIDKWSFR